MKVIIKCDMLIVKNKKAFFDYDIIETWEWGIDLKWYEVKSIRYWNVNLKWSYLTIVNLELFIKWLHISNLKSVSNIGLSKNDSLKKVFLHKKTILFLDWKIKIPGYSIVPLQLYFSWSLIKIKVALAKWRKAYWKKQILKERTMDKEAKIAMKKYF